MGTATAKSINLLLYEGDLNGVISIEDTDWNSGELYSAPRGSISDLLATGACNKYGVYLLLSSSKVYVGQSSDLAKRISQHNNGKSWWDRVVILTTKDDSLNHADIDYLESVLINMATTASRLDCDNKNKGNSPKVDKFRGVYLGQYLEEALFLLRLIGINVFVISDSSSSVPDSSPSKSNITVDDVIKLSVGKGAKSNAIDYLSSNGFTDFHSRKNISYAARLENKDEFWINPSVTLLLENWHIILNDTVNHKLIVLYIPATTFSVSTTSTSSDGFFIRKDRPDRLDLNINTHNLIDRKSQINLSSFVVFELGY